MRLNIRKFIFVGGIFVVIWLLISYSSMFVPVVKSKNSASEMELELDKLQNKMKDQLSDSYKLLEKVKSHLKFSEEKNIQEKAKESLNSENEVDMPQSSTVLPVLVIACDRVTVKRCLDNLVKFRPDKDTFPIIVSQDCGHNETYKVIRSFTDVDPSITVVQQPELSEIPLPRAKVKFKGYYKIARHYRFALNHVFVGLEYDAVIIVEDDLDISPDFFEYFLGTYPLLYKDPSIWCISAWNDNGKKELIDLSRPELLHRTDFFPGLGWLLKRDTWLQLEPKWPEAFFDDWLRDPVNTQGRACIRPEISRTYSFGKIGVSKGLFFDMHLRYMQLNMEFVEFTKLNLTYLLKENYDASFTNLVSKLPEMSPEDVKSGAGTEPAVRVSYSSAKTYQRAAKRLGLMDDFRSGIPRTAYRGIVTCFIRNRRVYLAPSYEWTKYDPHWG
ncbi:alpha-1,3-mannosyl-glycoprotein 2-beta-N-acetylglucosaminyltransferase isoform X3 [Maniola jurtina]|uniref:alpha-1,3-mannosyl-glycoprotein 2-beta-N-acetylglucosaminyltransferase isoform X1 n=1 Tax=Maniola jurtina TaxID=191418 RepID=UPI001E685D91|nr:alpha-1,3-mannosyl-glycoprotein 2-beta-N-acetylglucosaminyltransferase isoform X1 [Maniola jurtina]XP_045782598.1 alpha-1,3-mannosyl-glycoprotein 2-beta-N-acetylglucosaminyltransferase isoform X3 [Maniola jurtina]